MTCLLYLVFIKTCCAQDTNLIDCSCDSLYTCWAKSGCLLVDSNYTSLITNITCNDCYKNTTIYTCGSILQYYNNQLCSTQNASIFIYFICNLKIILAYICGLLNNSTSNETSNNTLTDSANNNITTNGTQTCPSCNVTQQCWLDNCPSIIIADHDFFV